MARSDVSHGLLISCKKTTSTRPDSIAASVGPSPAIPKFTLYVIRRNAGRGPGAVGWRSGACEQPDDSSATINAAGIANACQGNIAIDAALRAVGRQVTAGMRTFRAPGAL